jgi:SAM-dependent methyltransferase
MPTMYEIYDNYSEQYDELIKYEDYQNNLSSFLSTFFDKTRTVLELGSGTGRVTQMYIDNVDKAICCDKYNHMIERAKLKLKDYEDKIIYKCIDTKDIDKLAVKCDIIIEGWAVGHSAIDEISGMDDFMKKLFKNIYGKLNKDGKIIFIETMGSNVNNPTVPVRALETFYKQLEEVYGMKKTIIRTDYKFPSVKDAKRIMEFFFGEQIKEEINTNIIKEFTGIWIGSAPK